MKQTNVIKEMFYCDICKNQVQHHSDLTKCIICGREYCWVCKYDLSNVYLMPLCKECADKEPYHSYLYDKMWKVVFGNTRKEMIEHIKSIKRLKADMKSGRLQFGEIVARAEELGVSLEVQNIERSNSVKEPSKV